MVLPRLAGGSIPVELVAAAADASIFALLCVLCRGCMGMGGLSGEPPAHLPPPALEPAWSGTLWRYSGTRCTLLLAWVCLSVPSCVMVCVRWVVVGLWWF